MLASVDRVGVFGKFTVEDDIENVDELIDELVMLLDDSDVEARLVETDCESTTVSSEADIVASESFLEICECSTRPDTP